jgi:hypothetical protein
LNDRGASRTHVDAAFRSAVAQDEAAMLRRYFSFLRSSLA